MTVRAVLVPGAPVLLPEYAGQLDPIAGLRAACREGVGALVAGRPAQVRVVSAPVRPEDAARGVSRSVGHRVARHLLEEAGHAGEVTDGSPEDLGEADAVVLVGNGTACRSEKAPGFLDERAFELDRALGRAVSDGVAPPDDETLARELWCFDLPVFAAMHRIVEGPAQVTFEGDPFGVAYWVAAWSRLREGSGR
jgi:hypothetical protein